MEKKLTAANIILDDCSSIESFKYHRKNLRVEILIIGPETKAIQSKAFHRCINYELNNNKTRIKNGEVKRIYIPYDTYVNPNATINMVCDDAYAMTGIKTKIDKDDTIEFIVYDPNSSNMTLDVDSSIRYPGFYQGTPLFSIKYPTLLANRFSRDLDDLKNGRFNPQEKELASITITTYNGYEFPKSQSKSSTDRHMKIKIPEKRD